MPADRRVLGPLDVDTAPEEVANGRSAALRNVQLERGYATTARGNVAVGNALTVLAGVSRIVGACVEPNTKGVVWLQWNDAGLHRIARWQPGLPNPVVLLTWAGLNLPAQRGQTDAVVLDGFLIYRDAVGAVRSVSLARAAAGEYTAPLLTADPYALHLVKQPPHQAPTASRETNPSTTDPRAAVNRVAGSAWQFAYQYEYPDGERTVLSPFSDVLAPMLAVAPLAVNSGIVSDGRNFIRVSYPVGALAPSPLVRAVRLLARRADAEAWQVAGNFSTGVDFDFYGESTGEVLTGAEATKLAEALPRRVGAVTVAHSRVFVGDCTEGDTATNPVLTASAGPAASFGVTTISLLRSTTDYTYEDGYDDQGNTVFSTANRTRYWLESSPGSGRYYVLSYDATRLVYYNVGFPNTSPTSDVYTTYLPDETPGTRIVTAISGQLSALSGPPPASDLTLHERAAYPVGMAYYDAQGRTAGAESITSVQVPIQDYTTPQSQVVRWQLASGTVPPPWATSYGLLLGRNTTASFFLQFTTDGVKQFRGDDGDGAAQLENINASGAAFTKQVWVSVAPLLAQGRGYVFEAGDRLRFVQDDGIWYDYPLLYERGGYVAIAPVAVNLWFYPPAGHGLLSTLPVVEIYRPAPPLTTQLLYERGPRYAVLNPGTNTAALTVTSGLLSGDCAFQPIDGVTEAMLPSTNQWGEWLSAGRARPIALVPDGAQVRRSTLVRFGGEKIQGSRLNGLGQWEALDQRTLPLEAGAVVALHLAAQGQTEGRTLLAVQERGTETLYLGQVPLSASIRQAQTALLVQTDSVIGGTNELNGAYGTRHPGSVVGIGGRLFWWCADQGEVCRYAADGVNPLNSQHQCRALGQQWARDYADAEVVAGYDPRAEEYVLCFGATDSAPALTVRFSERADSGNGRGGFVGEVGYAPEAVVGSSDTFYGIIGNRLWRFSDTAPRLTWFGQSAATARASVWANQYKEVSKTWQAVTEEGGPPLWEVVEARTPEGQSTVAPAARMERLEGKWYGPLLMDTNSPGFTGTDALRRALYEGVPLQSPVLLATVACTDTTPAARLVALSVEFIVNSGQTAP